MPKGFTVIVIAALVSCAGCQNEQEEHARERATFTVGSQPQTEDTPTETIDPGGAHPQDVGHAVAVMRPTEGNTASGTITFRQTDQGVEVKADIEGLPEGVHAYHVHLLGDCSAPDGTSAGTHFNFEGSSEHPPADIQRITGNLGQLEADANGRAQAEATIPHASLTGRYSIIGRSVIIHSRGNDPSSPPIGNAGSRLACGVIGMSEAS